MPHSSTIRLLLVDDSAVIRGLMSQALELYEEIEIVGRAANGSTAIMIAKDLKPDIIILDIEMPVMDGLTALPLLLEASPKSKIIMASTLTLRNAMVSLKALSLGATDYLAKPTAKFGQEVEEFYRELVLKIMGISGRTSLTLTAKKAPPSPTPQHTAPAPSPAPINIAPPLRKEIATATRISPLAPGGRINPMGVKALAIASSTGGPQALLSLFSGLKGKLLQLPIFLTQHMPPTFTTILAEQLTHSIGRQVTEAKHGMVAAPGGVYVAPGDFHLEPQRAGDGQVILQLSQSPPENYCRPAADPMFRALSAIYGSHLLALVLTGMGQDGCEGAKDVVNHGGSVMAQDEASCVVYGMPRAVADAGLCKVVLPLPDIARFLIQQIEGR